LPADLVADLEAEARAEGIGIEELVSRLLVDELPGMVARKTARWLHTTLSLAYPIDIDAEPDDVPAIYKRALDDGGMVDAIASPQNEQSLVAGHHEARNGEDFPKPTPSTSIPLGPP